MEINGVKIQVPEGMECYVEDGEIRFRAKVSLYDVYNNLFCNAEIYYMNDHGWVSKRKESDDPFDYEDRTYYGGNCTSEKQARKLLAINQLMNVAKYLNGDWKPNWNTNNNEYKYYIWYLPINNSLAIASTLSNCTSVVFFKSKELAKQAIEILGEETIKLALSTDW